MARYPSFLWASSIEFSNSCWDFKPSALVFWATIFLSLWRIDESKHSCVRKFSTRWAPETWERKLSINHRASLNIRSSCATATICRYCHPFLSVAAAILRHCDNQQAAYSLSHIGCSKGEGRECIDARLLDDKTARNSLIHPNTSAEPNRYTCDEDKGHCLTVERDKSQESNTIFDVLKVLGKIYVGRKILVFVHYGVGWFLRLDFELVREIIWRNSVWESFRSCWVEKLCPSEKFVDHSFACLYEGQKLLTKWFWAKSASRFPCQELQALDGGQDGRVRQEGSNAKRKKRSDLRDELLSLSVGYTRRPWWCSEQGRFHQKKRRDSVRVCYQKRTLKDGERHTHAFWEKLLLADFGGFWLLFGGRERL